MAPAIKALAPEVVLDEYWDLEGIGAKDAWRSVIDASPVIVAVVDSGIDLKHRDLVPHLWVNREEVEAGPNGLDDDGLGVVDDMHGARFVDTRVDGNAGDDDGHGTLLSGIIAGVARQKIGLDYAPQPVKLMAVKFYDPVTLPAPANAAAAIRYAVRQGAKIICASWDVGIQTPELADAIAYAESSGVLIVTAAGNFGTDNDSLPTWPASTRRENVMAVMATDHRDERADFSNFGRSTVHLAAPGVDVLSTARSFTTSPRWLPFTGTSPAAAHVTGAAALLKAINPDWGPTMLRKHLMGSAQRIRGLECVAEGRLDLERAVLGPLCELSPRDGDVWKSGSDVQVRWTRRYETPGCQTVSLLLSEDGGRSYSVVLAPQQPNDGVCSVRVPPGKVSAARLRLMSDQGRFTTESGLFSIW